MSEDPKERKNPLQEIVQPFIDLIHAPRALWGINLAYVLEGMVYFGMLGYLAIYFSDYIFQSVDGADEWSHNMVMVLTAGITIAMFFLGAVADKKGVRYALIAAFCCMLVGRSFMAGAPNVMGLEPTRPGVVAGDTVSLHVTEIMTRNGVKTITDSTVIANDKQGAGEAALAIDLARGEGIAPSAELESQLVSLSKASIVDGDQYTWEVSYGSAPVTTHLFASAAQALGFCKGAVISLERAYVGYWPEREEWIIRSHWADDIGSVDTSACEEQAEPGEGGEVSDEDAYRSDRRWPIGDESATAGDAPTASLAELQEMEDGPVNVILRDLTVTYVRNGGYFLQGQRDGPAIFDFVAPWWSPLHIVTLIGMVLVVIGYGMYQPAAYAGVRLFTTPKTAAMGFAMLYALMNLGGWLPTFAFLLRDDDFLGLGIPGTYWVYTGFTLIALLSTIIILTPRTVREAIETAKLETEAIKAAEADKSGEAEQKEQPDQKQAADNEVNERVKPHMWLFWLGAMALLLFKGESPWYFTRQEAQWRWILAGIIFVSPVVFAVYAPARRWLARHPLGNGKFAFFIFALIPVQTLFTYNWFILPQYINRAFTGWIGEYFEVMANANPLLIFIAVPIIAAITQKAKVYNMMIIGTFVMAAPAFLLTVGPKPWALIGYLLIMTIGEAMWQPRFLQYAAEIAPKGRTGEYMGVAQFPWFLTKVLVPLLYSGSMMDKFCPAEGPKNTEMMWFVFGCIAIMSTVFLLLAKRWIGKDFKTKADE